MELTEQEKNMLVTAAERVNESPGTLPPNCVYPLTDWLASGKAWDALATRHVPHETRLALLRWQNRLSNLAVELSPNGDTGTIQLAGDLARFIGTLKADPEPDRAEHAWRAK